MQHNLPGRSDRQNSRHSETGQKKERENAIQRKQNAANRHPWNQHKPTLLEMVSYIHFIQ